MKYSESTDKIFTALAHAQQKITNLPATSSNPFFKSKYTPLDDILDFVRPILAENGLTVVQMPRSENGSIGVITIVTHSSGQYFESDPFYLTPTKQDPQMAGSAITYARRYALAATLGIASDTDDDGNGASKRPTETTGVPEAKSKTAPILCAKCGKEITSPKGIELAKNNPGKKVQCPSCTKESAAL